MGISEEEITMALAQNSVMCEKFSTSMDVSSCLSRRVHPKLGLGCKGCEKGEKLAVEYHLSEEGKKSGEGILKTSKGRPFGLCTGCNKQKYLISKKTRVCAMCYKRIRREEKNRDRFLEDSGGLDVEVHFQRDPALLDRIRKKADLEYRDVSSQILWELRNLADSAEE